MRECESMLMFLLLLGEWNLKIGETLSFYRQILPFDIFE